MPEISNSPMQQYIPDLDFPRSLAKVIAAHDVAHEAWRETYVAVVQADAALTRAPATDAAALVTAVAAGKDHPGQQHEHTARAALAVAEEHCRVAREEATRQTDIVKGALAAATEQLVPIILANVRAMADAHAANLEQCTAIEAESRRNLQTAMSAMRMIAPHIANRYGISVDWSSSAVDQPAWPSNPTTGIRHKVENLEQMISQAPADRETASASA